MNIAPKIITITALIASAVAAQAISFPPVLMPEDEFAGRTAPTRNTYHIDGRVYTVWEAPPYPHVPMGAEYNDAIRIRIQNITPGSRFVYPDEWFTPELLAVNAGRVLTQDDYKYIMDHFWNLPHDIVGGLFDGLFYDTANFSDEQIIDYLNLVSLSAYMPEREAAGLFGGDEANSILIFALTDDDFAYRVNVPMEPSTLSAETREAVRRGVDWSSIDFGFATIFGSGGAQLKGQNFSGTNITGSQLERAARDMDNVNFSGLDLTGLNTMHRTFRNANLSGTTVTVDQLKAVASGGLTGSNLSGTGITREMLLAQPNRRPMAEVNSITF